MMKTIQKPFTGEITCLRCAGCKQIANSEDGEAWTVWQSLPPGADLAVRMGIVRPIPCPNCGGTGKIEFPEIKY